MTIPFVVKVHDVGFLFYNPTKGHSLVHVFGLKDFNEKNNTNYNSDNISWPTNEQKKMIAELEVKHIKTSTGKCSVNGTAFCQFPDDLLESIFVKYGVIKDCIYDEKFGVNENKLICEEPFEINYGLVKRVCSMLHIKYCNDIYEFENESHVVGYKVVLKRTWFSDYVDTLFVCKGEETVFKFYQLLATTCNYKKVAWNKVFDIYIVPCVLGSFSWEKNKNK